MLFISFLVIKLLYAKLFSLTSSNRGLFLLFGGAVSSLPFLLVQCGGDFSLSFSPLLIKLYTFFKCSVHTGIHFIKNLAKVPIFSLMLFVVCLNFKDMQSQHVTCIRQTTKHCSFWYVTLHIICYRLHLTLA